MVPGSGVANHKKAIAGSAQRSSGQPKSSHTTPATQSGIDQASS
jgi:hypothetical protein